MKSRDLITVDVINDDTEDIFVTLVDNNVNPPDVVDGFDNKRFNKDDSYPAQIQPDGGGQGNITWKAVRCNDSTTSKTGNDTTNDGDVVKVTAR